MENGYARQLSENDKRTSMNNKIIIYSVNPNQQYILVQGKHNKANIKWELLTDGIIQEEVLMKGFDRCFWENPSDGYQIRLNKAEAKKVIIKNSSYAVMQGFENNRIKRIKICTELSDLEKINKIIELADIKYKDDEQVLSDVKPYIRQITLN